MQRNFLFLEGYVVILKPSILRLWEAMRCRLESEFLRYKMYKLHIVSEKIRKSKLLSQEASSSILDPDPGLSVSGLVGRHSAGRNSAVIYKERTLILTILFQQKFSGLLKFKV